MSDEIGLKDARTQNIRQGAGTSHNNVDGSNQKKERQRKKTQNIKNKIKKNQQRVYLMSMKFLVYCVIIMLYRCPLNNFNIATTGQ